LNPDPKIVPFITLTSLELLRNLYYSRNFLYYKIYPELMYDPPGIADDLNTELLTKWNDLIELNYQNLSSSSGSRFFKLDHEVVENPSNAPILWFGDPAEPNFCMGPVTAQQLSDWDYRGRNNLHNEYIEYSIVNKRGSDGELRPKRVQITTELREYWMCIAKYDPDRLRRMIESIMGVQPSWQELYGVSDPFSLTESKREMEFSRLVAGNGKDLQPAGSINTDNALFMTHPINGLDDLLYIVMFGARPFAARNDEGGIQMATREQIFRSYGVEHLACRHADPAAAMGAYGAVFNGRDVAFANPLGMYMQSINTNAFLYNEQPIPQSWIGFSRGQGATNDHPSTWQRLEIGPPDSESVFLDDIRVSIGGSDTPLTGGYQIVQQIEVGPLIIVGEETQIDNSEYVNLDSSVDPILCHQAEVCNMISDLKNQYDLAHRSIATPVKVGPRRLGRR